MLLRYEATLELDDQSKAKYTFSKPVDVSTRAFLCTITAVWYGGLCWWYLRMPTFQDRQEFIEEAHKRLDNHLHNHTYTMEQESIELLAYNRSEYKDSLTTPSGQPIELQPAERASYKIASMNLEKELNSYIERKKRIFEIPNNTFFLSINAGTSFSQHGRTGVGLGYRWGEMNLYIGLGVGENELSPIKPISMGLYFENQTYFLGLGISTRRGSGFQSTRFKDHSTEIAEIDWKYTLTHLSAGTYLLQNALLNYQITVEGGVSFVATDSYKVHSSTSSSSPRGVVVDNQTISRGNILLFARIALIYWLRP